MLVCHRLFEGYIKLMPNLLIFWGFNLDTSNTTLSSLIENNDLYRMMKEQTCFKSQADSDLMSTNMIHDFLASQEFETGFSDFHHIISSYNFRCTTKGSRGPRPLPFQQLNKSAHLVVAHLY